MITLKKAGSADRDTLWNLFQKYYYEMSAYYELEMDAAGNYAYRWFDSYFAEKNRAAYFIFEDAVCVGFVMLNDYSCLDAAIDRAIAEFTIFPRYRRQHLAWAAARQIFLENPGRWEIKYSRRNAPAAAFWPKAAAQYAPRVTAYGDEEMVLSFTAEP